MSLSRTSLESVRVDIIPLFGQQPVQERSEGHYLTSDRLLCNLQSLWSLLFGTFNSDETTPSPTAEEELTGV